MTLDELKWIQDRKNNVRQPATLVEAANAKAEWKPAHKLNTNTARTKDSNGCKEN